MFFTSRFATCASHLQPTREGNNVTTKLATGGALHPHIGGHHIHISPTKNTAHTIVVHSYYVGELYQRFSVTDTREFLL